MIRTEILVAGGGPSGASVARLLRQLGHDVWLVDRGADRRRHHLESLSPATWLVLESLGLRANIEAARLAHAVESFVSWPAPGPPRAGWVIDRRCFDEFLLDAARAVGVTVVRPAKVCRPTRTDDGGWLVPIEESGARRIVCAEHLIDASGRRGVLGGARTPTSLPLVALCGDFEDLRGLPPWSVVVAGHDAWFWGATLSDGRGRAIAFVHPTRDPSIRRDAQLAARLASVPLLAPFLRGRLVKVSVTDASSWQSPLVEDHAIKIGDAACCIDPISSQGIQSALVSAIKGAAVVHALRTGGDVEAARELYRLHVQETARAHAVLSAQQYMRGGVEAFWRERASHADASTTLQQRLDVDDDTRLWLQPGVARVEMPSLNGLVVCRRAAVTAPTLAGPVTFVDGIELAPLVDLLRGGEKTREIALRWAAHVGPSSSVKVLAWSLRMGLLAERPDALSEKEGSVRAPLALP
jgi:flavin-dependent dehydrogenase